MAFYLNPVAGETQLNQSSFIGGRPKLPAGLDLPRCDLCSADQTFMFQLDVPEGSWSGETLAAFCCTSCVDENYLIPPMLGVELRGADIPAQFLVEYQKNFRFLTFPTGSAVLRTNHIESVEFRALNQTTTPNSDCFGKVGGDPDWLTEDETPATYAGEESMIFLAEIYAGWQFTTLPSARPQVELDIRGNPSASPFSYYQLFLGNALFLFGPSGGDRLVYALTQ